MVVHHGSVGITRTVNEQCARRVRLRSSATYHPASTATTGQVCCVCVVVPSILSAGFHLWGASAGVTQEEGQHTGDFFFFICFWFSTFLLRCLPFFFIARRVQHSLSLVDREVEFCVPTTKSLSTVGCCARKNPRLHRDLNPRPNRQKVTRLPTEPPGRPVSWHLIICRSVTEIRPQANTKF